MKYLLLFLAAASLVATIVPAILYLTGSSTKDTMQWCMLGATIVWFAVAPFCGDRARKNDQSKIESE